MSLLCGLFHIMGYYDQTPQCKAIYILKQSSSVHMVGHAGHINALALLLE